MGKKTKFYLVAADALPEIFLKVAEAKRMLHAGEVSTAGEAARQVGISRSAFYKYRDSVQPFNDMKAEHIITFYGMLKDNTGVLSRVLSVFAQSGANILTINHSREDRDSEVGACIVSLVLETRNSDHVAAIKLALTDAGYPLLHNS